MGAFQPPRDGSVLIIDDRVEEALPLLKLLSQGGVACTYYSGKDNELPERPIQKIRLAFIDIQLFPSSDANTYAQNILRLLDRIVPDENGPYILIVWSKFEDVYADELQRQVTSPNFDKRPVIFSRLSKADYFEAKTNDSLGDTLEDVYSSLRTRFSEEDLTAIKNIIDEKKPTTTTWEAKDNALELIYEALQSKLEEADTLQLFTIWENLINKASGKIVKSFSALYPTDDYWRDNLKSGIYRLAHAQLGKKIEKANENELIVNALKTLNHSFLDVLENEISTRTDLSEIIKIDKGAICYTRRIDGTECKIEWVPDSGKFQLFINNSLIPAGTRGFKNIDDLVKKVSNGADKSRVETIVRDYKSMTPTINTKLLIDSNVTPSIQPGNVWIRKVRFIRRRRELIKNYFRKETAMFNTEGECTLSEAELRELSFIELEVTPLCDYAQNKWLKARLLPGILVPEKYAEMVSSLESLYQKIPLLIIEKLDGKLYKPVFNFNLLKSCDIEDVKNNLGEPIFRVRNQLFADILSRLSSHINRVGIASVE